MPATPKVPTALAEVRVQTRRGPGVPDVVLVGHPPSEQPPDGRSPAGHCSSAKSTADDDPPVLGPGAGTLGVDEQWLAQYRVRATAGSVHLVPLPRARPDHGWLVGTGRGTAQHWRAAGAALIRASSARVTGDAAAGRRPARTVQVHLPPGTTAHQAAALTLGCVVGSHSYRISSQGRSPGTTTVRLVTPPGQAPQPLITAVARAQLLARATGLARDLANTPSGHKDPAWLAGTAARLAATVPGLRATVRDQHWLAEHGFGGVLAVGGGSARPPRLLELAWRPAEVSPEIETEGHLVLSPTSGSVLPAPRASPPRCSCGSSPQSCPGRTWTSPVRPGPNRTMTRSTRVAPGSPPEPSSNWPARSPATLRADDNSASLHRSDRDHRGSRFRRSCRCRRVHRPGQPGHRGGLQGSSRLGGAQRRR
ncbi:MAG: hypothetical protein ACRDST_23480 [Pseudonocardiaceae bacterium]